jgi:hypothetical protein
MEYKVIENEFSTYIERDNLDGTFTCIPTDPANSDYQAYLAQLEAEEGDK